MRSSKLFPLKSIIASYKARHLPYTKQRDYYQHLLSLAAELHDLKDWFVDLTVDVNYFRFYTYVYLNPLKPGRFRYVCPSGKVVIFNHEPFYVGKGQYDRCEKHLVEARKGKINHKNNTIRKIWKAGSKPIIIPMPSRVSDWMAQAFEIDLIAGIGRANIAEGPLTNNTDGGEGTSGAKMPKTREHKEKLRQANLGKTHTKETRAKLSKIGKGRPQNIKHSEKIRRALLGKKKSAEHCAAMSMAQAGRKQSPGHVAKRIKAMTGQKRTLETRINISKALTGVPHPQISCPHCGVCGGNSIMKRWHMENCRHKHE